MCMRNMGIGRAYVYTTVLPYVSNGCGVCNFMCKNGKKIVTTNMGQVTAVNRFVRGTISHIGCIIVTMLHKRENHERLTDRPFYISTLLKNRRK